MQKGPTLRPVLHLDLAKPRKIQWALASKTWGSLVARLSNRFIFKRWHIIVSVKVFTKAVVLLVTRNPTAVTHNLIRILLFSVSFLQISYFLFGWKVFFFVWDGCSLANVTIQWRSLANEAFLKRLTTKNYIQMCDVPQEKGTSKDVNVKYQVQNATK